MKTRILSILLLSLTLLWPTLRNGGPFLMSDTTTYIRGADAAVYRLTGTASMWTGTFINRYGPASPASPGTAEHTDSADLPVTIAGRSIFYGALLYLFSLPGSFWGVAIFQALVTATAVTLAAESLRRASGGPRQDWPGIALLMLVLGLSPAGYFAGFMMPDIFLPLGLLAFCQIAFLWDGIARAERSFWIALLTAAMLFHTLHLLIIGSCFLALQLTRRRLLWRDDRQPAVAILFAITATLSGQTGVSLMIARATGAAPVGVPFVAARLIADGPGRDYLIAHCPQASFRLCNYRSRLRNDSDTLLWSYEPENGIFSAVPPRERRQIAAEQTAFMIAVARDRPWAVIRSTASSILRQAGKWALPEFNYAAFQRDSFGTKLPRPALENAMRSAAYRQAMPVRLVEIMTPLLALAAVPPLFILFRRRTTAPSPDRILTLYLAMIVGAIILNIVICGGVSTPHDRYQMRLIWLLPLCVTMLWTTILPPKARPI
jgi:hypothetical protein